MWFREKSSGLEGQLQIQPDRQCCSPAILLLFSPWQRGAQNPKNLWSQLSSLSRLPHSYHFFWMSWGRRNRRSHTAHTVLAFSKEDSQPQAKLLLTREHLNHQPSLKCCLRLEQWQPPLGDLWYGFICHVGGFCSRFHLCCLYSSESCEVRKTHFPSH